MYNSKSAYRSAWDNAYTDDPSIPLNVDIELASICNLACPMCYYGEADFISEMKEEREWDGGKKRRFMPTEMAIKLIDECASIGVPALKMNFRGESTLHPDYSEILKYARSRPDITDIGEMCRMGGVPRSAFHDLLVNTNANCNDKAIDGLMAATKVMVSLDSMVPETYAKMRVNGKLERALEVIDELRKRKHPDLWVRRVITSINKKEKFVESVKYRFGNDIKVSEHFSFDRNHYEHLMIDDSEMKSWDRQYCGYPSQRLIVTSNGKVMACCVAWRDETLVGYWPDQSIMQIWNGQPIQSLRRILREGAYERAPTLCQNCTSFMSYKRKERDYVQDKEAVG